MRRSSSPVWLIAAIAFVTALLWRWWCVPYGDDYIYSHLFEVDHLSRDSENWLGVPISNIHDAVVSVYRHYLTSPGRLANTISFFVPLLPSWLIICLSALAVAAQPLLIAYLAAGRRGLQSPTLIIILYLLSWLLLPWYDHMQSIVFLTNYVASGCAMLAAMILVDRVDKMTRGQFILTAIFVVIASWMHEGFSVSIVAYIFGKYVLKLFGKSTFKPTHATHYPVLLMASLLGFGLSFSPGTLGRLAESTDSNLHISVQDLILLLPTTLLALLTIWQAIKKSWSDTINRFLPYWLGIGANIVVVIVSHSSMRALWPTILLTLTGLYFLATTYRPLPKAKYLWMPLLGIYIAFMVSLINAQRCVASIHDRVHKHLVSSTANIIYCDDIATDSPWYCLGIPLDHKYTDWLNLQFENQAAAYRDRGLTPAAHHRYMPVIMPDSLRCIDINDWPTIPGDNPFRGTLSHIVSTDSIPNLRLRLHLGSPNASMTPLQHLVTQIIGKTEVTVTPRFDRIGTYANYELRITNYELSIAPAQYVDSDSSTILYRVSLPEPTYLWSNRIITAVDTLP